MPTLIFPQNSTDAKRLARAVSKGELKRIRRGIYTDADWGEIPRLIRRSFLTTVAFESPEPGDHRVH